MEKLSLVGVVFYNGAFPFLDVCETTPAYFTRIQEPRTSCKQSPAKSRRYTSVLTASPVPSIIIGMNFLSLIVVDGTSRSFLARVPATTRIDATA